MKIGVIGANGMLGKAIMVELDIRNIKPIVIQRDTNYKELPPLDLLVNAAGNSKKYLADTDPAKDFEDNVFHIVKILSSAGPRIKKVAHVSSSEVYGMMRLSEPMKNEFSPLQPHSNYGFSKMVAEQVVQNYSKSWTIFRLGGLFGEGMSKGPLFDLINQLPLRLMGNSTLQLMNTSWAAKILLDIATGEAEREIFNLASSEPLTILEISKCLSLKPIFAAEAYSYYSRLDVSKISSLNRIQSQYDQLKDFVWSRT